MKKKNELMGYSFVVLGLIIMFTNSCTKQNDNTTTLTIPELTTTPVTSITYYLGTGGGNITSDGGSSIISRGVCWSENSSFTIDNCINKTTDGTGGGSFISNITELKPNTTYYVRAYATNSTGTGYGNLISFKTLYTLSIGESYQGGIIAYIQEPGYPGQEVHGLIAAPFDQGTNTQWGCHVTIIPGTSIYYGTGMANTLAIVNACSEPGIAARICNDLVLNGYNDWYLPSKGELNMLYINRTAIGGFSNNSYWSSSDGGSGGACSQYFATGFQTDATAKFAYLCVRAIRSF